MTTQPKTRPKPAVLPDVATEPHPAAAADPALGRQQLPETLPWGKDLSQKDSGTEERPEGRGNRKHPHE